MYAYAHTYENKTNAQKNTGLKSPDRLYRGTVLQYRKPILLNCLPSRAETLRPAAPVVQKQDGIEPGSIVYLSGKDLHEGMGEIIAENPSTYTIKLFSGTTCDKPKDIVVPMHSNLKSTFNTFNSVMLNGVLSPYEMSRKGLHPGAYTSDANASSYNSRDTIDVNIFSVNSIASSNKEHTFYSEYAGAYFIALENNRAPKMKLPPLEYCRAYVEEHNRSELDQTLGKLEQYKVEGELPPLYAKLLNGFILQKYLNSTELINTARELFEARLKRTMLVISPAPAAGPMETQTTHIEPENFTYILVPDAKYAAPTGYTGTAKIEPVASIQKTLKIPAKHYFTDNDGNNVENVYIKMNLNVPDYDGKIDELGSKGELEGNYYSHIVRL